MVKPNKERIQKAADFVENLSPIIVAGFEFLPEFKLTLKHLEEMKLNIVSGAAIIGEGYREKELNCEYRIERIKGVIHFLEAYKESENTIKEIEKLGNHAASMTKLFGV